MGADVNAKGCNFEQGPHDGAKGVLRDPLLIEFLEGGHVVDRIGYSNVVVDDTFILALDKGGDVDRGGSRGAEKESNKAALKESQLSMSTSEARLMLRV